MIGYAKPFYSSDILSSGISGGGGGRCVFFSISFAHFRLFHIISLPLKIIGGGGGGIYL